MHAHTVRDTGAHSGGALASGEEIEVEEGFVSQVCVALGATEITFSYSFTRYSADHLHTLADKLPTNG